MAYLDKQGLSYFWNKIKTYVDSKLTGIPVKAITQAEYDALSEEDKNGDIVYLVTDAVSEEKPQSANGMTFLGRQSMKLGSDVQMTARTQGAAFLYKDGDHGLTVFMNAQNRVNCLNVSDIPGFDGDMQGYMLYYIDISNYINVNPDAEVETQTDILFLDGDDVSYKSLFNVLDLSDGKIYLYLVNPVSNKRIVIPSYAHFQSDYLTFKEVT